MKDYYDFNIVEYLQDSKKWDKEIEQLQDKVEEATQTTSIDYSKVGHGNAISDPTGRIVSNRETPLKEIDEIKRHKYTLSESRKTLSEAENKVIDLFFYTKGKIPVLVDDFSCSYGYSRAGVYRLRKKALENLKKEIKRRV